MQPMGHIAGMAAITGFISTIMAIPIARTLVNLSALKYGQFLWLYGMYAMSIGLFG